MEEELEFNDNVTEEDCRSKRLIPGTILNDAVDRMGDVERNINLESGLIMDLPVFKFQVKSQYSLLSLVKILLKCECLVLADELLSEKKYVSITVEEALRFKLLAG